MDFNKFNFVISKELVKKLQNETHSYIPDKVITTRKKRKKLRKKYIK